MKIDHYRHAAHFSSILSSSEISHIPQYLILFSHVRLSRLMATEVKIDLFMDDRLLGLTIGHLMIPL